MAHIAEREFELFVGIDWSGAKGPRQPGLSVFAAGPGKVFLSGFFRLMAVTGHASPFLITCGFRPQKNGSWQE